MAIPDDARLVRVEELEEVTVCDFVAISNRQMSEHDRFQGMQLAWHQGDELEVLDE